MAVATETEQEEFLKQDPSLDFTITTSDFSWKVHHKIIAEHSPVFRVACFGPFKERAESTIDLPDESPFTVARLLQWIYEGKYCSESPSVQDDWQWGLPSLVVDMLERGYRGHDLFRDESSRDMLNMASVAKPLEVFATVYSVAEKYGIVELQKKTSEHVAKLLNEEDKETGRELSRSSFWKFYDLIPQYLTEEDDFTRRFLADIAGFTFDTDGKLKDERMRELLVADADLSIIFNEQLYSRNAQLNKAFKLATYGKDRAEYQLSDIEERMRAWTVTKKQPLSEKTYFASGW